MYTSVADEAKEVETLCMLLRIGKCVLESFHFRQTVL